MKIQIRARDISVTRALQAHVELRLGFALSRFGERIGHVAVDLSMAAEHSDVPEILCRISVSLPRRVKVQETHADLFAAVNRAATRAARSVALAIEQEEERTLSPSPHWKDKKPKPPVSPLTIGRRNERFLRRRAPKLPNSRTPTSGLP